MNTNTNTNTVNSDDKTSEALKWGVQWSIAKRHGDWTDEQIADGLAPEPYEVLHKEGNIVTNAGVLLLFKSLRGDASLTAFNAANSYIGVGDGTTAAAATQTDLQAATNKLRKGMAGGWPKVGTADGLAADNQMQFQASFLTSEANFHWQEWGIFNASVAGTMLNRKVEDNGTKTTGTYTFTVTITIS